MNDMEIPEYKFIGLEQLRMDAFNPRLPESLHGKSEEEILEYMLLDAAVIKLMLAIGTNGYFPGEPILVVYEEDGYYKVISGNRRLCALKLLTKPELAVVQKVKVQDVIMENGFRPSEISCLIFTKEEDVSRFLGYQHITGIKEWKQLEKVKYLYDLWKSSFSDLSLNKVSRELAKRIGSRKDYVKRLLVGYQIYKMIENENFSIAENLDGSSSFVFNCLVDSLSKPHFCDFINVDLSDDTDDYTSSVNLENLQIWSHWVIEKKHNLFMSQLANDNE